MRTSRGVRMYFLPTTEAMTYWDGWERMRPNAAGAEPGAGWREDVATGHGTSADGWFDGRALTFAERLREPTRHERQSVTAYGVTLRWYD